jgi:hypothetical protein
VAMEHAKGMDGVPVLSDRNVFGGVAGSVDYEPIYPVEWVLMAPGECCLHADFTPQRGSTSSDTP